MSQRKPWTKPAFSQYALSQSSVSKDSPTSSKKSACSQYKPLQCSMNKVSPRAWKPSAFSQYASLLSSEGKNSPASSKKSAVSQYASSQSSVDKDSSTSPPAKQKCVRINKHSENWIDSFAPKKSEELAVHAKKLTEVKNWLCHCKTIRHKYPAQICLLTGPSGSGKTATVRTLAKEAEYELHEWINPIDHELITTLDDRPVDGAPVKIVSQLDAFKSFLFRASRYKSLLDVYDRRLLMVEDLPNTLISDPETFESVVDEYMNYGKSPLIFVVTDSKTRSLNISYNLFTDQLKAKHRIEHISFNPIAITLMQKAMKHFCALMCDQYADEYRAPVPNVIDSIIVSAQGDIRNALINLHFSALKGAPGLAIKRINNDHNKTSKAKSKTQNTLKAVGCDESITLFHALGRVLNPKFNVSAKLLHSPEEIAESFTTQPKHFVDFVHSNYVAHFRELEHIVEAADDLSLADLIMNEYRDDTMATLGLNLGIRSVMLANKTPMSGWLPVRGIKRIPKDNCEKSNLDFVVSAKLFTTEYRYFANIINKSS